MKKLYVYDFDKTLVPYDSFRRYLLCLLRYKPIYISILLLLRKMRLIGSKQLKYKVTNIVDSSNLLMNVTKRFAYSILKDICWPDNHADDATRLIITASPMVYMKYIAEELQCKLLCSSYIGDIYNEMYGETKGKYLHEYYPVSKYQYTYAISDSKSDECWMQEFNNYELI